MRLAEEDNARTSFKPFIYHRLEAQGHCTTIKQASVSWSQAQDLLADILPKR